MSQYIEFSNSPTGGSRNKEVSVWSKDGQDIQLELGFYYKIIPGNAPSFFLLFS